MKNVKAWYHRIQTFMQHCNSSAQPAAWCLLFATVLPEVSQCHLHEGSSNVNMYFVGSEQEMLVLNIHLWQSGIWKKKSIHP